MAGLAGCAFPPALGGDVVLGQFQAPDGGSLVLSRSSSEPVTYLASPGSGYGPLRLRRLDGVVEPRVVRSVIANGQTVLLVRGSAPGCPSRHVILATRLPITAQAYVPDCDKAFDLQLTRGGTDVVVLQVEAAQPIYYTFHQNELYGPARVPASVASAPVARGTPRRAAPPGAAARPAAESAPVDLDRLAVPSTRVPTDLDK